MPTRLHPSSAEHNQARKVMVVITVNPATASNGNGRLTAKQHSFLMKLSNEKGLTRKELNDQCVESYGSVVDYLNRSDASA